MPVLRYGATFWQRLCTSIAERLGAGWSVVYLDEQRKGDGTRLVITRVSAPLGKEQLLGFELRPEFDQLRPEQRMAAFRVGAEKYAAEIKAEMGDG